MEKVINNILNKVEIPNLIELLVDRLSFGELQSLLLKIYELKTRNKNQKDLLREYQSNKFVKPSDVNPLVHRYLELTVFSLLPADFQVIELSPLTPLGTSSVLTTVHQNNIVSTIRNVEVAADTTNTLALECANRRNELLKMNAKSSDAVKLCSSQKVTRAQPFENKGFSACFNLIALCTAGRDEGHEQFETVNLEEHIQFYINILEQIADANDVSSMRIKFFSYKGYDNTRLIENIKKKLFSQGQFQFMIEKNSECGKNYYSRLRFMISVVNRSNQEFDYIDGGFTDWTAKLLNNKKERLLTSGIGTDYLLRTIKTRSNNHSNI